MKKEPKSPRENAREKRKATLVQRVKDWLELPMVVLGFLWLLLLIWDLVRGLTPVLDSLMLVIWIVFILGFALELATAPSKVEYLRRNWLTVISLILPALRVLRALRAVRMLQISRTARGLRFFRIVGSLNRGMSGIKNEFGRRGAGYVVVSTLMIMFVGAAGMFAFERNLSGGPGLNSYADALWWTAMIMTTLGSQYWPTTMEGRFLGFLLSLYSIGVFGYLTAVLATFFIGREKETRTVLEKETVDILRKEIASLRQELCKITALNHSAGTPKLPGPSCGPATSATDGSSECAAMGEEQNSRSDDLVEPSCSPCRSF